MHFPQPSWAADLRWSGTAAQLPLDRCAEALGAERVLALQMAAYGCQLVIGESLPYQLAVGGLP